MSRLPTADRIVFRRWSADDLPLATLLWSDPEVTRYLGGPYTPEKIAERLRRHLDYDSAAGVQYWPFFLRGTGELVGCCGLRPPEDGLYEHGFHLRTKFHRQGFGTEAAGAVIRLAFDTLGAAGLWAAHHPDNAASAGLLRKLGFVHTHHERFSSSSVWHVGYHRWPEHAASARGR